MNCEELRDYYEMYALGVAEEPERDEIRTHLNRGCEVCMNGVKRAIEMAALLGGTAPAMVPPARLRRRILASVGFEQRGFGLAPFFAAATVMCLVAAVYFFGRERESIAEIGRLQKQLGTQTAEVAHLNEVLALVNGPDTVETSFGEKKPAKGKIFASPRGVLLMASNLSPAPSGKMYEMWVIPKGATIPQPAGMFQSGSDGTAMHMMMRSMNPDDTVAVTLE